MLEFVIPGLIPACRHSDLTTFTQLAQSIYLEITKLLVYLSVYLFRFHELVERYNATDGAETFTGLDYALETPTWAVYGSNERGFDPQEKRWRRKGKLEANVDGGCG